MHFSSFRFIFSEQERAPRVRRGVGVHLLPDVRPAAHSPRPGDLILQYGPQFSGGLLREVQRRALPPQTRNHRESLVSLLRYRKQDLPRLGMEHLSG